jgi:DNA-binding transcriptional regulator YhcF (GntR family)
MSEGWIKLHRQWLQNPIAQRPYYGHLWVTLLLKASHKKSEFIWNNKKRTLRPGQLVTGRKKLSEQTGIPESTVERILTYLEGEQQIEQQKTNKFRIITVKNWEKYQGCEKANSGTDSKWTTNEQQADTYKNDKNVKNNKKKESKPSKRFQKPTAQEVCDYAASIGFELDGQEFVDFYEAKGWLIGKNKMTDWRAAVRTWKLRSRKDKNGPGRVYRTDTQYQRAAAANGCIEI